MRGRNKQDFHVGADSWAYCADNHKMNNLCEFQSKEVQLFLWLIRLGVIAKGPKFLRWAFLKWSLRTTHHSTKTGHRKPYGSYGRFVIHSACICTLLFPVLGLYFRDFSGYIEQSSGILKSGCFPFYYDSTLHSLSNFQHLCLLSCHHV